MEFPFPWLCADSPGSYFSGLMPAVQLASKVEWAIRVARIHFTITCRSWHTKEVKIYW